MTLNTFLLTFLASATLAGCGGGGDSTQGNQLPNAGVTANVFADVLGTYSSGCVESLPATATYGGASEITTIVFSNPIGTDKATVSIQGKYFPASNKCLLSTDNGELTVGGQITHLIGTKVIAGTANRPKAGVAKTAEFRLDSFTLTKGTVNGTVPAFGTTTKVGYLIEGTKGYFINQTRDADGLGGSFSTNVLTKQ
jgi:hypothetical protein